MGKKVSIIGLVTLTFVAVGCGVFPEPYERKQETGHWYEPIGQHKNIFCGEYKHSKNDYFIYDIYLKGNGKCYVNIYDGKPTKFLSKDFQISYGRILADIEEDFKKNGYDRKTLIENLDSIYNTYLEQSAKYNKQLSTMKIDLDIENLSGFEFDKKQYGSKLKNMYLTNSSITFEEVSQAFIPIRLYCKSAKEVQNTFAEINRHIPVLVKKQYDKEIKALPASFVIENFVLKAEVGTPNSSNELPVQVKILGKNFTNILPNFVISNNDLELEFKDSEIILSNRTNQFLKINSLSFYFDTDIKTIEDINVELPPQGTRKVSNDRFLSLIEKDYKNITKKQAGQKLHNYGMAAKYNMNGASNIKTLYKTNSNSVLGLIKDRGLI